MTSARSRVLSIYKKLHQTRKVVFNEDETALNIVRAKINDEFKKNKTVEDDLDIEKLIKAAQEIETELRTKVVQAKYDPKSGNYKAKVTKDTEMTDTKNRPTVLPRSNRKNRKCGEDPEKT